MGTDPALADSDGDGANDGVEIAAGTDPLIGDSDLDGYADGYELNVLSSDPLDADSPGGPNPLAIGINFNSIRGQEADTARSLSEVSFAGVPEVAQKNWNQTEAMNVTSFSTLGIGTIASPSADELVDSRGDATSVGLSFTMNNSWNIDNEKITPYGSLFAGYLDSNPDSNVSVTLTNIPYASYDVYVYVGAGSIGRRQRITDGETTYSFSTAARFDEPGVYTQTSDTGDGFPSANYAKFSDNTDPSITLTFLRGNGNGGINAIQIVATGQLTAYEQWAAERGLNVLDEGAGTADPDKDGVNNLLEFVLGTEPEDLSSNQSPTFEIGASDTEVRFERTSDLGEFAVEVKWSTDLQSWFTAGVTVEENALEGGKTEVVTTLPGGIGGKLFF